MGADARSTVGTATDTNAMVRVLFSRLGDPHIGSAQAFSFNVASVSDFDLTGLLADNSTLTAQHLATYLSA